MGLFKFVTLKKGDIEKKDVEMKLQGLKDFCGFADIDSLFENLSEDELKQFLEESDSLINLLST